MAQELDIFIDFIKSKNLRFTPERRLILEAVFKRHDHFCVDDLYLSINKTKLIISKASIYRTMPLLLESKLIQEVFHSEKNAYYEHIYGHDHHEHMICSQCHYVVEFDDHQVHTFFKKIAEENNFQIQSHHIEINGLCSKCQQKK